jgi:hypothetical protein
MILDVEGCGTSATQALPRRMTDQGGTDDCSLYLDDDPRKCGCGTFDVLLSAREGHLLIRPSD